MAEPKHSEREIRRKKKRWKLAKQGVEVDKYRETEKKVRNMIRNAKRNFEKRLASKETVLFIM